MNVILHCRWMLYYIIRPLLERSTRLSRMGPSAEYLSVVRRATSNPVLELFTLGRGENDRSGHVKRQTGKSE